MSEFYEDADTAREVVVDDLPADQSAPTNGDATNPRFSSVEACRARIAAMGDVARVLRISPRDVVFSACINEIVGRCRAVRSDTDFSEYERMWYGMVLSICAEFRRSHFPNRTEGLESKADDAIIHFMENHSVPEILQALVDVAQENSWITNDYYCQLQDKNVDGAALETAYESNIRARNAYREYVILYQRCTGRYRPRRFGPRRGNRGPNGGRAGPNGGQVSQGRQVQNRASYRSRVSLDISENQDPPAQRARVPIPARKRVAVRFDGQKANYQSGGYRRDNNSH